MYYRDEDFTVLERLESMAAEQGVSAAQLALAWLLHRPGMTAPIVGATKMYQLEEAAAAVDIDLTDDEMAHLEDPYLPHPVLGHGDVDMF